MVTVEVVVYYFQSLTFDTAPPMGLFFKEKEPYALPPQPGDISMIRLSLSTLLYGSALLKAAICLCWCKLRFP